METYPIYSLGSGEFLQQIFIGLQLLMGANNSESAFFTLGFVGVWIGALIIGFQSIYSGGRELKGWGSLIGGGIVFAIMFGFKANVEIRDMSSGAQYRVDNVPQGPAMIGYVVSSLGYEITNMFDVAFAPVTSSTSTGRIGDTLKVLNDVRSHSSRQVMFTAIDDAIHPHADSHQTLVNYIADCTLSAIDLGDKRVEDLYSGKMPEALRYNHHALTTQSFVTTPPGAYQTCAEAWTSIQTIYEKLTDTDVSAALNRALGLVNAGNWDATVDSALDGLNLINTNAQDFVFSGIVQPVWEQATHRKYETMMDMNAAISMNSVIERRNLSYAAEETLFHQTVRPLMAFFEGFTYAVTPFVALLLLMSSFGTSIAIRYFQTLIWIQLWMPMASIINLYMSMSAAADVVSLAPIASGPLNAASFYLVDEVATISSTWLGIGAKMMASIPVISLAIITGSSYGMVQLMSSMNQANKAGADAIANNLSPQPLTVSSVMAGQSMYSANTVSGATVTGGDGTTVRTLASGTQASNTQQSQAMQMNAATQQLTRTIQAATANTNNSAFTSAYTDTFQKTLSSTYGISDQAVQSKVNSYLQSNGINTSLNEAQAARFAAGVSLGDFGISADGSTTSQKQIQAIEQLQDQFSSTLTESEQAALADAKATSAQHAVGSQDSSTVSNDYRTAILEAAGFTRTQTNQYLEAAAFTSALSSNKQIDLVANSHRLEDSLQSFLAEMKGSGSLKQAEIADQLDVMFKNRVSNDDAVRNATPWLSVSEGASKVDAFFAVSDRIQAFAKTNPEFAELPHALNMHTADHLRLSSNVDDQRSKIAVQLKQEGLQGVDTLDQDGAKSEAKQIQANAQTRVDQGLNPQSVTLPGDGVDEVKKDFEQGQQNAKDQGKTEQTDLAKQQIALLINNSDHGAALRGINEGLGAITHKAIAGVEQNDLRESGWFLDSESERETHRQTLQTAFKNDAGMTDLQAEIATLRFGNFVADANSDQPSDRRLAELDKQADLAYGSNKNYVYQQIDTAITEIGGDLTMDNSHATNNLKTFNQSYSTLNGVDPSRTDYDAPNRESYYQYTQDNKR